MASFVNCESKPLRKSRLGPPDVYPQDPKQKEDELTFVNVKQGFSVTPATSEEYGSARNHNLTNTKVVEFFSSVLSKKFEINTLPETGKKRQQVSHKDNYWPVPTRPKAAEVWLKDLVSNKPLTVLAKKVPIFNKREEILTKLCDYSVPTLRACWLIKMSSAYYVAISETKNKSKRQLPDQTQEWTQTMQRFLREQLIRLEDYYSWTPQHAGYATLPGGYTEEQKVAARQWQYATQLASVMYEEGLLERELFLEWIMDTFRSRAYDDGLLKLLVPLLLQYANEYANSELLSRKLSYYICKKLNSMIAEAEAFETRSSSPTAGQEAGASQPQRQPVHSDPLMAAFIRMVHCDFTRDVLFGLSSVLQVIVINCPTALVWNNLNEGRPSALASSPLIGSPLDLLPCSPAMLPLPNSVHNHEWRSKLLRMEADILERSRASEARWSVQTAAELSVSRVLTVLDALDQHKWNRVDDTNNMDILYSRVFQTHSRDGSLQQQDTREPDAGTNDVVIQLLCEWAVSSHRLGEHRSLVVAMLLEKRQSDLMSSEGDGDDRESVCSGGPGAVYMFQDLLFKFLDTTAPVLESSVGLNDPRRQGFCSLVLLFLELTRHDVFSHDHYLRTLISRGELRTNPASPAQSATGFRPDNHEADEDRLDIDDDLDKLVQHIKSTNADMDNPDSPKEGFSMGDSSPEKLESRRQNRHLIYTTHFPLPQDDAFTDDDKQRHILLFGVKKARDEARHSVKKMNKEIMKLFGKKFSIDVAEGGKVKRQCRGEFPFEAVVHRFQALSFYDQHMVTHQCATQVLEMLSLFASGTSNYLPVVEHVSFLFDLMELSMNVQDLLDLCIQMLRELTDVESQLHSKNSIRAGTYATSLALHVVGACRRYHSSLILSQEQTAAIFEGLCKAVKHVPNHTDCSSAERCIMAYLVNLYSSCQFFRSKHYEIRFESFSNAYLKLKQMFNTSMKPSGASFTRIPAFMAEYVANPTRAIEPSVVRALNENPANRYSFVCNVVIEVCNTVDSERLGDLAVLAAEATARCIALSPEWLAVLDAMCGGSDEWMDVVSAVDVASPACHRSVALFMTVLAARHCIYMDDVIKFGAHCLMVTCSAGDREREPGARLVLRLLGHLWIPSDHPQPTWYDVTPTSTVVPSAGQPCSLKYSCDRHLLLAAQDNILVPALLCAVKAIIILADATIGDSGGRAEGKTNSGELSISAILGTSDHHQTDPDQIGRASSVSNKAGLSEFARHMLKQICGQAWVREKFLSSPEEVVSMERFGSPEGDDDVDLLERVLTHKQARRLFHMIVHPDNHAFYVDDSLDARHTCSRILDTVDQWSMRVALLDLRLLYRQTAKLSSDRHSAWLNTLARCTVDVFHSTGATTSHQEGGAAMRPPANRTNQDDRSNHLWLIPPLVAKLPAEAQCRILQASTQALESASWMRRPVGGAGSAAVTAAASTASAAAAAVAHQPFRQLVLSCVRGQEEQREELVSSLQTQFQQLLCRETKDESKDKEEKRKTGDSNKKDSGVFPDENKTGWNVYNALQLRFSLLGGVFDSIQHGNLTNSDAWILLLTQLVTNGVVTLYNNSDMYTTVLDMIATLIHSAVVGDTQSERPEENKRHFYTLGKKLRKELGDRKGVSIKYLRQFLPIPKKTIEVINTELKSAPLPGFEIFEKRRGLTLVDKQKVSPWDLLEGHRNPAPLSWSWFGAVKLERVPSKFEEMFRILRFHDHHMLIKPDQYFLEAPPLPPEELEPVPELKQKEEIKPPEVTPCDSPRGGPKRARGSAPPRKKRTNNRAMNNASMVAPRMSTPPMQTMPGMAYQPTPGAMYGAEQSQQWGFQQQQRPQGAGPYFAGQQLPPGAGPRFQAANSMINSKAAISAMLRSRQPNAGASFMQPQPPAAYSGMQMPDKLRHQMMRDQMRAQQQQQHGGPGGVGGAVYASGPPQPNPGMPQQMYAPSMAAGYNTNAAYMPQQQGTMMTPQGYTAQQGQGQAAAAMMQSQQAPQSQAMMMRPQQAAAGAYMTPMRPTGGYMASPNVTVNAMQGAAAAQYRPMQQRMRHPMMMQAQQQQQPTLMNQLRQPTMGQPGAAQGQPQQPQQQHNHYQFHHQ